MVAALTITKPNAFVHLHQIIRKQILCPELDAQLQLSNSTGEGLATNFGLSPAEAMATTNLLKFVPPSAIIMLEQAARKRGMWKGPFTHQALACERLRIGFRGPCEAGFHKTTIN